MHSIAPIWRHICVCLFVCPTWMSLHCYGLAALFKIRFDFRIEVGRYERKKRPVFADFCQKRHEDVKIWTCHFKEIETYRKHTYSVNINFIGHVDRPHRHIECCFLSTFFKFPWHLSGLYRDRSLLFRHLVLYTITCTVSNALITTQRGLGFSPRPSWTIRCHGNTQRSSSPE